MSIASTEWLWGRDNFGSVICLVGLAFCKGFPRFGKVYDTQDSHPLVFLSWFPDAPFGPKIGSRWASKSFIRSDGQLATGGEYMCLIACVTPILGPYRGQSASLVSTQPVQWFGDTWSTLPRPIVWFPLQIHECWRRKEHRVLWIILFSWGHLISGLSTLQNAKVFRGKTCHSANIKMKSGFWLKAFLFHIWCHARASRQMETEVLCWWRLWLSDTSIPGRVHWVTGANCRNQDSVESCVVPLEQNVQHEVEKSNQCKNASGWFLDFSTCFLFAEHFGAKVCKEVWSVCVFRV